MKTAITEEQKANDLIFLLYKHAKACSA